MEMIRTSCPQCQANLKVPAEMAGKQVKCKKCGSVIQTKKKPAPPAAPTAKTSSAETAVSPKVKPAVPVAARPAAAVPVAATPAVPIAAVPVHAESGNGATPVAAYPAPAYGYPQPQGYGYPPPGYGYPPPAYGYPPPEPPAAQEFAQMVTDEGNKRRRRRGGTLRLLVTMMIVALVGSAAGAYFFRDQLKPVLGNFLGSSVAETTDPTSHNLPNFIPTTDFPRRMLVLNVTKYLYCNNLTAGDPRLAGDHVTTVASKLAFHWRIPTSPDNNQLFIISDTARNSRPMLKPIIEESYTRFFETSRKQDHVVVYFGGHAVAEDGKAYLVPVDGDMQEPETLVPLEDFWAKLAACPAQQKVVLFDVCRLNEDDEKLRPGSEPMSEELQKLLLAAPDGVQVALSCSAGENSLEFRRTKVGEPGLSDVAGSAFLSALKYVATKGKAKPPTEPTPDEPLTLANWIDATKSRLADIAALAGEPKQTIAVAGQDPAESPVKADKSEAVAKQFDLPTPPKGMSARQLAPVLSRVSLAPIKPSGGAYQEARIEEIIPFSQEVMSPYMPDGVSVQQIREDPGKYAIRNLTLDALKLITDEWGTAADAPKGIDPAGAMIAGVMEDDPAMNSTPVSLRVRFEGESDEDAKKGIVAEQEKPARIILLLDDLSRQMDALVESGEVEKESSMYWKVTFAYAHAQVKARLAFMHEYNLALAYIRTDSLPEKGKGDTGWQMVSVEEMKSKRDVKEIADIAQEMFDEIADKHKGTPWAVLSKRARSVALGLEWRTYNPGGKVTSDE